MLEPTAEALTVYGPRRVAAATKRSLVAAAGP